MERVLLCYEEVLLSVVREGVLLQGSVNLRRIRVVSFQQHEYKDLRASLASGNVCPAEGSQEDSRSSVERRSSTAIGAEIFRGRAVAAASSK